MPFAWAELSPLYVLHCQRYPLPHGLPFEVPLLQHGIGPLASLFLWTVIILVLSRIF